MLRSWGGEKEREREAVGEGNRGVSGKGYGREEGVEDVGKKMGG